MVPVSSVEWWRRVAQPSVGVERARPARSMDYPVAFWALMTFFFILLLAPQAFFPALVPFRIALLAAAVAAGAYVLSRAASGRPIIVLTREMKIAGCLFGWAILTIPFAYHPGGSVATLTDLFLKSLLLFWLIANIVSTVSRLRQFAWALSLMSVPLAATGLTNYMSGNFLRGRLAGYEAPLTGNPNDLALTLNLVLPFALALIRVSRSSGARAVLLGIIALDVVAVIVTFSRAGFLTLCVILGIIIVRLLRTPRRAWGVALLGALLLCLPLLPASYWARLATVTDIESDLTGSSQLRWAGMLGALRFIATHPIVGAGPGGEVLVLNEEIGPTWGYIHNVYLEYAVDLGLPGLALFLLLFAACLRAVQDTSNKARPLPKAQSLRHLADATRLGLIAFGVAAFFHPVAYHFYFYFLAGMAVAARTAATR